MKRLVRYYPWLLLVLYWPFLFLITHIPRLRLQELQIYGRDLSLHFAAYLLLTLLFWFARYGGKRPSFRQKPMYVTLVVLTLYAGFDELSQHFVKRTASGLDFAGDVVGVVMGLAVLYLLRRWSHWFLFLLGVHFATTHWPWGEHPLVIFMALQNVWEPLGVLQQYQATLIMGWYVVLTLVLWRTLGGEAGLVWRWSMAGSVLLVLGGYAVVDEGVRVLMGYAWMGQNVLAGLLGILVGSGAAWAWAHHYEVADSGAGD